MMKRKVNLYKKFRNTPRDRFELWIDLHNHKFELIRTISSLLAVTMNAVVLLKLFHII